MKRLHFFFLVAIATTAPFASAQEVAKTDPKTKGDPVKRKLDGTAITKAPSRSTSSRYEAIVRIENSALSPDYRTPWNYGRDSGGSGTGFLIGKNRFLTNAHVVSDSRLVYIKKVGDAKPYRARIVHIAHDCDLAMLELEDDSAFADVRPMQIGELPQLDSEVKVIGFPIGGERISVTSGVVSRIDFNTYSHSAADLHLTVQIDAAINPGNSGGPVIQNDKVVGVAFQGYSGAVAQNTGYMIPVPVIKRFLKDVEDGRYDHYVDLSVSDFTLLNPAQRQALGLPNDGLGIMVARSDPAGSAGDALQTGDVLLAIDGHSIKSNGLVNIGGENVNMNEIVERKFAGDKITLTVWREQKKFDTEITLKRFLPYLITAKRYDKKPRYVMFGGLVFQPLDRNLMGAHSLDDIQIRYLYGYYATDEIHRERPEVVVLTTILPDSINSHLKGFEKSVVDKINGKKIRTLKDVHRLLTNIPEKREFVEINVLGEGRPIVVQKDLITGAQDRIKKTYNVLNDSYLGE